jgi:hypoxanthine phosphoribosyltransferase
MVGKLLHQLPHNYDNIMVITRGGMVPACLISEKTNIRNILCASVMFYDGEERALPEPLFLQFPEDSQVYNRRILLVDDVWDTGSTIIAVRNRLLRAGGLVDTCVLHYKPGNSRFPDQKPDYVAEETDAWIVYPWDPERELP